MLKPIQKSPIQPSLYSMPISTSVSMQPMGRSTILSQVGATETASRTGICGWICNLIDRLIEMIRSCFRRQESTTPSQSFPRETSAPSNVETSPPSPQPTNIRDEANRLLRQRTAEYRRQNPNPERDAQIRRERREVQENPAAYLEKYRNQPIVVAPIETPTEPEETGTIDPIQNGNHILERSRLNTLAISILNRRRAEARGPNGVPTREGIEQMRREGRECLEDPAGYIARYGNNAETSSRANIALADEAITLFSNRLQALAESQEGPSTPEQQAQMEQERRESMENPAAYVARYGNHATTPATDSASQSREAEFQDRREAIDRETEARLQPLLADRQQTLAQVAVLQEALQRNHEEMPNSHREIVGRFNETQNQRDQLLRLYTARLDSAQTLEEREAIVREMEQAFQDPAAYLAAHPATT